MAMHKKRIALHEVKKLRRKGLSTPPIDHALTFLQRETSIMAETRVEDIMTKEVMTVHPQISVSQLLSIMTRHHHMGYPVVNRKGELMGIVTFEDVMKVSEDRRSGVLINQIAKKKLITAYPNDSVLEAFEKMSEHEIGRILIVDPENPKKLCGVLTRTYHARIGETILIKLRFGNAAVETGDDTDWSKVLQTQRQTITLIRQGKSLKQIYAGKKYAYSNRIRNVTGKPCDYRMKV